MANSKKPPLALGGTIRLTVLPKVLKEVMAGEAVNIALDDGEEIHLQIQEGVANRILEMTPFFKLEGVVASISTGIAIDGELTGLEDALEVDIKGSEGREFAFTISPKQAEALAKVLMNYVVAVKAVQALQTDQPTA